LILNTIGNIQEAKEGHFDAGEKAIRKLATIIFYALIIDAFCLGVEYFTAFYSHVPAYSETFRYLFFGIDGNTAFVPWFWVMNLAIPASIALLAFPAVRRPSPNGGHLRLAGACIVALIGLWIDKGFLLVPAAFIPNVFGRIMEYSPSWVELTVSLGIYCLGMRLITALYKVIIAVRGDNLSSFRHMKV
jgi:Ni/Fe-hydrogenase subunit HybB-like protein